jgi:hypothetical protein
VNKATNAAHGEPRTAHVALMLRGAALDARLLSMRAGAGDSRSELSKKAKNALGIVQDIHPFCRFTSACPAKYQHLMPSFLSLPLFSSGSCNYRKWMLLGRKRPKST